MLVSYVHIENPKEWRNFDTEKAYKNCPLIFRGDRTQKEYDNDQLKKLASDKEKGIILDYFVLE